MGSKAGRQDVSAASAARGTSSSADDQAAGEFTVGRLLEEGHMLSKVLLSDTLRDLTETLLEFNHSAAVAVDGRDCIVGLLTENDVMRAYFEGATAEMSLGDWLSGGLARAPGMKLQRLAVAPSATLYEVAEKMVSNTVAGDCACHHVVVKEESGQLFGLLSASDLLKAMCSHDSLRHNYLHLHHQQSEWTNAGSHGDAAAADAPPSLLVRDVMKSKDSVFACSANTSIKDAISVLLMTRQNCVLVVDGDCIVGSFATRDAVAAFERGMDAASTSLRAPPSASGDGPRGEGRKRSSPLAVASDRPLAEAADLMVARHCEHAVVVHPESRRAVGLLSALDIVVSVRCSPRSLRALPLLPGGTLADVLDQPWHYTGRCTPAASLADVAGQLLLGARMACVRVENDKGGFEPWPVTAATVLRAFVDGRPGDVAVRELVKQVGLPSMAEGGSDAPPPPSVLLPLPPSVLLPDAAALFCQQAVAGGLGASWAADETLVVVSGADGERLGFLSALDLVRGAFALSTPLELASTGANSLTVGAVAVPAAVFPRCRPDTLLRDALRSLLPPPVGTASVRARASAVLVVDEEKKFCGALTARTAARAYLRGLSAASATVADLIGDGDEVPTLALPKLPPEAPLRQAVALLSGLSDLAGGDQQDLVAVVTEEATAEASGSQSTAMPLGFLTASDAVRGVASMLPDGSVGRKRPFASLAWLHAWPARGGANGGGTVGTAALAGA
eukprot:TRINITY_DN73835_c0_g1_i1.p1 TRINITY_DN73835_c0_g1~~TRINITY_DN73835_c0_g1_i1.p1  ORF type:complete len:733 (-),score=165.16 TRINITY_DN73835_c0_g1_i1:230-2428(-)